MRKWNGVQAVGTSKCLHMHKEINNYLIYIYTSWTKRVGQKVTLVMNTGNSACSTIVVRRISRGWDLHCSIHTSNENPLLHWNNI